MVTLVANRNGIDLNNSNRSFEAFFLTVDWADLWGVYFLKSVHRLARCYLPTLETFLESYVLISLCLMASVWCGKWIVKSTKSARCITISLR